MCRFPVRSILLRRHVLFLLAFACALVELFGVPVPPTSAQTNRVIDLTGSWVPFIEGQGDPSIYERNVTIIFQFGSSVMAIASPRREPVVCTSNGAAIGNEFVGQGPTMGIKIEGTVRGNELTGYINVCHHSRRNPDYVPHYEPHTIRLTLSEDQRLLTGHWVGSDESDLIPIAFRRRATQCLNTLLTPISPRIHRVTNIFNTSVQNVAAFGMPVRFLREIQPMEILLRRCEDHDDDCEVSYVIEEDQAIYLNQDTLESLSSFSNTGAYGATRSVYAYASVGTLYHEATHAYLHGVTSIRPQQKFQDFVAGLLHHYEGTPDPERIHKEAPAEYVGQRVYAWFDAYQKLALWIAEDKLTPQRLDVIRRNYNRVMADRVVGYYEDSSGRQIPTDREISPRLQAFLDDELLENRLYNEFNDDPCFQEMIADARIESLIENSDPPERQNGPR
jgi:hypothetical protein